MDWVPLPEPGDPTISIRIWSLLAEEVEENERRTSRVLERRRRNVRIVVVSVTMVARRQKGVERGEGRGDDGGGKQGRVWRKVVHAFH